MRCSICRLVAAVLGLAFLSPAVLAAPNCSTALGKIARSAAEKAIEEKKGSVCSGLKSGSIAIDRTKTFELRKFNFCEDGLIVTASAAVYLVCGTSDAALIRVSVGDEIKADAKVDLDTCKVLEAKVTAESFLGKVGLSASSASQKLADEASKAIAPYCRK